MLLCDRNSNNSIRFTCDMKKRKTINSCNFTVRNECFVVVVNILRRLSRVGRSVDTATTTTALFAKHACPTVNHISNVYCSALCFVLLCVFTACNILFVSDTAVFLSLVHI